MSSISGQCVIGTKDPAPLDETISALSRFMCPGPANGSTFCPAGHLNPAARPRGAPDIRRGCRVHAVQTTWMGHPRLMTSGTADRGAEREPRQPQDHPRHRGRQASAGQPERASRNKAAGTRRPERGSGPSRPAGVTLHAEGSLVGQSCGESEESRASAGSGAEPQSGSASGISEAVDHWGDGVGRGDDGLLVRRAGPG